MKGKTKRKSVREGLFGIVMILGFFGTLYPQYGLPFDTYKRISEERGTVEMEEILEDYKQILAAHPGEVSVKLAFLEELKKYF